MQLAFGYSETDFILSCFFACLWPFFFSFYGLINIFAVEGRESTNKLRFVTISGEGFSEGENWGGFG